MGGYSINANNVHQAIDLGLKWSLRCQPAYYKSNSAGYVYVWSENDHLRAFPFDRTTGNLDISNQMISSVPGPIGAGGAMLSVSSDNDLPAAAYYGRLMLLPEMPISKHGLEFCALLKRKILPKNCGTVTWTLMTMQVIMPNFVRPLLPTDMFI